MKSKILSNNTHKALINDLADQIKFLKIELRSKCTTINLIIKNIITNISKIKTTMIENKLKNSSPKNLQNSKHQAIKILTTLYPSTLLKYQKKKNR